MNDGVCHDFFHHIVGHVLERAHGHGSIGLGAPAQHVLLRLEGVLRNLVETLHLGPPYSCPVLHYLGGARQHALALPGRVVDVDRHPRTRPLGVFGLLLCPPAIPRIHVVLA